MKIECIELDELYNQFSHWLDDPDGRDHSSGRDVAVFRFARRLLKRALSDSFANVALKISEPCSKVNPGSDNRRSSSTNRRSQSMVDHLSDEKFALYLAKDIIHGSVCKEPDAGTECDGIDSDKANLCQRGSSKIGLLVSIVLHETLADVELALQGPNPRNCDLAILTNSCPGPLLGSLRCQESIAWEYNQNPSCSFHIRMPPVNKASTIEEDPARIDPYQQNDPNRECSEHSRTNGRHHNHHKRRCNCRALTATDINSTPTERIDPSRIIGKSMNMRSLSAQLSRSYAQYLIDGAGRLRQGSDALGRCLSLILPQAPDWQVRRLPIDPNLANLWFSIFYIFNINNILNVY